MARELAASRVIQEEKENLPQPQVNQLVFENPKADRWVVMGGSGQMGKNLSLNLVEKGARVVATSRRGQPEDVTPITNVTWEKTSDTASIDVWENVFRKQFNALGPDKKLYVVNVINNMENYEDNVRVAEAAAQGLAKAAQKGGRDYHLVHVSSMAAGQNKEGQPRVPNDPYSLSKTKSEEVVVKHCGKEHVTLFRMGYGLDQPTKDGKMYQIDNEHAYAPDQMAALPLQFIIGDGKQSYSAGSFARCYRWYYQCSWASFDSLY